MVVGDASQGDGKRLQERTEKEKTGFAVRTRKKGKMKVQSKHGKEADGQGLQEMER